MIGRGLLDEEIGGGIGITSAKAVEDLSVVRPTSSTSKTRAPQRPGVVWPKTVTIQ